ncbi:cell division protein FtsA [Halalkalibacterium ligniniphilum]|uniref:cell division protein FtsA n=1 Tax=Halalkalibacterium ligniniphilum TaxID=1134413 RepID=UPI00034A2D3D|nr:cell division protein FtsA [Halalkalibacterium ligniniphilum]
MSVETVSPVFALDIGTRSVVGLLLNKSQGLYELVDVEIIEHDQRSMLDGQIHNVPAVAAVIQQVKEALEKKHGPLKRVCVAAAGRSLKTKRSSFHLNIDNKPMFERDDLLHLELSAVQKAQFELAQEEDETNTLHYYCVGYSVLSYRLDGEEIGSLLDQTGQSVSVEVIATFLPKVVVESLLAALSRANLELEALTLEPIAAINVLIPPSMRRLNVALVDIGAGTSDIAITDEGAVTAYGMVPVAGDEITEAISDHFLLDFPDAERVKRQLGSAEQIVVHDILGFETMYAKEEILTPIQPAIKHLASSITEEILALNGKAPKAVMLVGGGSMTPELTASIADALQLPANRVAIRGIDAIKTLASLPSQTGPELVTPIGIAITAKENPIEYISIEVNGQIQRLFDVKTLTVGDGLLAAGVEVAKLYGKPGMAMMVTFQGRLITIPGEYGQPPKLLKNGEPTTLDAKLEANDHIEAVRGEDGKKAQPLIGDLVEDLPSYTVYINDKEYVIRGEIYRNNQPATLKEPICERDEINVKLPATIAELFAHVGIMDNELKPFYVFVNGRQIDLHQANPSLTKNGKTVNLNATVQAYDAINYDTEAKQKPTVSTLLEQMNMQKSINITVTFNGEPVTLEKSLVEVWNHEKKLNLSSSLSRGEELILKEKEAEPFLFQELFQFIEVDLAPSRYQSVTFRKNGKDISFQAPLIHGDRIEMTLVEKPSKNSPL